jgi:predicted O-linked N-acetylglucosamine transferase (SPINDLY family)
MASRLGGSILSAGGLADCVHTTPADYAEAVIALGQEPHAITALRQRIQANSSSAPLFDTAARAKEWEYAWTHMVERQRSGLAPEAFDIPVAAGIST